MDSNSISHFQLKTATEYTFRVRACSELTKLCGNWSANVTGTTSDGIASAPTNLRVDCNFYNMSGRTVVSAQWEPPAKRNGVITSYHIELYGFATYRSLKNSALRNETYGPKVKTVNEKQLKAEYENIPFNTNYTVKVSAITRSKKPGTIANASCSTPRSTPAMSSIFWGNFRTEDKYMIKLYMPDLSERNGPICGYRIYLVRMPQTVGLDSKHLPSVSELNISTYHEVHAPNNTRGGAYIAETLSNDIFQNEIILGDGHSLKDNVNVAGFRNVKNEECRKLLNGHITRRSSPADSIGLVKVTTEDPLLDGKLKISFLGTWPFFKFVFLSDVPDVTEKNSNNTTRRRRRRRQLSQNSIQVENSENGKSTTIAPKNDENIQIMNAENLIDRNFLVFDGPLDPSSNYTGFVEVIGKC